MDRLVEETLKYGLIPPVVMEFPGITVGGGYSGTSGESSSFKHGFFDRTLPVGHGTHAMPPLTMLTLFVIRHPEQCGNNLS